MRDKFGQLYHSANELADRILEDPAARIKGVLVEASDAKIYNDAMRYHNQDKFDDELELLEEYTTPNFNTIADYDKFMQSQIQMPSEYKNMDIWQWLITKCSSDEEIDRVTLEYKLFESRGLIPLLRYLKYMIDVFREHNIVWGVGRGSSVASFILYLIGVHKINSIKYNLDIHEFLR